MTSCDSFPLPLFSSDKTLDNHFSAFSNLSSNSSFGSSIEFDINNDMFGLLEGRGGRGGGGSGGVLVGEPLPPTVITDADGAADDGALGVIDAVVCGEVF